MPTLSHAAAAPDNRWRTLRFSGHGDPRTDHLGRPDAHDERRAGLRRRRLRGHGQRPGAAERALDAHRVTAELEAHDVVERDPLATDPGDAAVGVDGLDSGVVPVTRELRLDAHARVAVDR